VGRESVGSIPGPGVRKRLDFRETSLFLQTSQKEISPRWKGKKRKPFNVKKNGRGACMIQKVKGGYKVVSESGKNLGGPYKTKAAAQKRLRQVEYFKHRKQT
jgi:hypothetical protein